MRTILAFAIAILSVSAQAQHVSVRLLREDGTPLDSAGKVIPGRVTVEILSEDPKREFHIRSGEIILGREHHRVASLATGQKRIIDLMVLRSQGKPGDFILFEFFLEEKKAGLTVEAFERKFRYDIR